MARYRPIDMSPKLIPADFSRQVLPGSFEYALCHLIDHELDLSAFDARYRNDDVGAPAYAPGLLLKVVLLAYSRGLVSSRAIEAACRTNVLFMAVSGDAAPNFTTLAAFVSERSAEIAKLFTQVLLVCDRQGLIGRQMFAIDGVKLPANAAKARSGRRADFLREAAKMESAVKGMIERHRAQDADKGDAAQRERTREADQIERLEREAARIRRWLEQNPDDRAGSRGATRLSNRTDNESAKMATDKGVIQGYCGVAAVDEANQIILEAQAHGTGSEQALLAPMVEVLAPMSSASTVLTADAGYHSKANCEQLEAQGVEAFLADNGYRQRDPRYAGRERHTGKPDALWDKTPKSDKPRLFGSHDFTPAKDFSHCRCPAGKRLYRNGGNCNIHGLKAVKFTGAQRDCLHCPLRAQCLRHPERTKVRQVAMFLGRHEASAEGAADRMKRRIDSPLGRQMIARRFATVEPVFANLRHNKGLDRFTLRGRTKVDGQWKLFCLVHNIEKLANHGYGR
jgi:transposase